MSWTDERVETLKKMWGEGQSASQIAKELGGVTRNAVIGKVHRLGLSNRVGPGGAAEGGEPSEPVTLDQHLEVRAAEAPEPAAVAAAPKSAATQASPVAEPVVAAKSPVVETPSVEEETDVEVAVAAPPPPQQSPLVSSNAPVPLRRPIMTAGQPLPPQPSANEISPETLATARELEKRAKRLSLMELTERTCKWPIGDPATPEFWFCGLPSEAGKPYCETHVSVAFQPMSARRDRRR